MRLIFLFFLTTFYISTLAGQVTFQPKSLDAENKGIIYNRETTVDFKVLQTNGMALGLNFGRIRTYYLTNFYHFELGYIKHTKEYRKQAIGGPLIPNIGGGQSYIFGKRNQFILLRGGVGQKRYFTEKAKLRGLAVGVSYEAGPTIGMLKPYYLDLGYPLDNGTQLEFRSEKYSESNREVFLNDDLVGGFSGFSRGLGEISIMPGVHGQASLHLDWGAFDEFVKAMEAGIMIDLFFDKVPIMVEAENVENQNLFINLFLTLQLGKRR
jgi:hypothetical protein